MDHTATSGGAFVLSPVEGQRLCFNVSVTAMEIAVLCARHG